MAIADDFLIDYSNKRIYNTGTTLYSVNALYSYLQDTFDEQDQMDDAVPMSAQTPTEYTMTNSWFLGDDATHYLYGGAIQTSGYLNEIHVLTLSATGYTSAVAGDIGKQVTDDAAEVGALLAYNNTTRKWWVRIGSATPIASGSTVGITGGTGAGTAMKASVTGEDLYANIYTLGSIADNPESLIYVFQNLSRMSEWWNRRTFNSFGDPEHIDVLIKVKEAGTEIDGANITVLCRQYADGFDHYDIDLSSGGRNAVPLASATDLNNATGEIYLIPTAITNFDVGNFVRGGTSGAYGELLATATSPGNRFFLGNVVGTFVTSETLYETVDGTSSGDTGTSTTNDATTAYTNVVAGYGTDIDIYHVSGSLAFDAGQDAAPALYATVTGATYGATGIVVEVNLTSGSWAGDDAAGTLILANVNGSFADNETVTYSGGQVTVNDADGLDVTVVSTNRNFSLMSEYPYSCVIDLGGSTVEELYEWVKYVSREYQSSQTFRPYASKVRQVKFGATYTNCVESDVGLPVTGGTSGDSGVLMAYNNSTKVWDVYMDACTGTPASDDLFDAVETVSVTGGTGTGTTVGASCAGTIQGQAYVRSLPHYALSKASPFGTFAGGVFFGARGVWIEDMDSGDANSYSLIDHDGTVRTPPAQVEVKITAVESGDRCGVFLATGDNYTVEKEQYSIQATHTAPVAYIRVEESIPNDTPPSGYIRVVRRDSEGGPIVGEERYAYTAFSNASQPTYSEFTLSGTTTQNYDTYDTAYVPYIDEESTGTSVSETVQYVSDRYVVARVRKKGIIPFQTKGQIQSTGYSTAAIRTEDTIVT